MLSWRNPGPEQSDWDIDTYAERILSAIDAVREVTGSEDVNVIGFCAGGILNTAVLNHLASTRRRADPLRVVRRHAARLRACPRPSVPSPRRGCSPWPAGTRPGRGDQCPVDGQRVHVDAAQRPGVELLGQQLPDGRGPAGLRHPVVERRRDEPPLGTAPAVPRHLRAQPAARRRAASRCSATRSTWAGSRCRTTSPARSATT